MLYLEHHILVHRNTRDSHKAGADRLASADPTAPLEQNDQADRVHDEIQRRSALTLSNAW